MSARLSRAARAWQAARGTGAAWAAGLLAGACVAWSAIPMSGLPGIAVPVLAVAAACTAATVARLALGPAPGGDDAFAGPLGQAAQSLAELVRSVPWAEGVVVTVLVLEALHRSRPWHTGLLGTALVALLFAVHLAESRARVAVLRPQAPVIAAGLGLLALAAGAAALPAETGSAAGVLAILAAVTAVAVAGLALRL